MPLLSSADFFQIDISKKTSRDTIKLSNGLDLDQDRLRTDGPDLSPNCLQRLSADDKSRHQHT